MIYMNESRTQPLDARVLERVRVFVEPRILIDYVFTVIQQDILARWKGTARMIGPGEAMVNLYIMPYVLYRAPRTKTRDERQLAMGYLPVTFNTWEEELVYHMAHEFKHVDQYQRMNWHDLADIPPATDDITEENVYMAIRKDRYKSATRFQHEQDACIYGQQKMLEWRAANVEQNAA